MPRQIVINSTPQETRVGLMEGPRLLEIFIERARARGLTGNIYKGRVTRVLPGLQAAFVDIGLEKAAFLHVANFSPDTATIVAAEEVEEAEEELTGNGDGTRPTPIEERIRKSDEIVVQVAKEPIGNKGARVTAQISLPGRHLVFIPTTNHIGISRRIEDAAERQRLREAITSVRPPAGGLIARTSCEGLAKREIVSDVRFLSRLWNRISKKAETSPAPALLHYDMDLILRVVRDLFNSEVQRVIVDSARDHQRILSFLEAVMPQLASRITLHEGKEPVFERYNIETQIGRALERKVRLKSGGTIVIDHTEALTAIDVNTGRYVGKDSQEETALRTNLEAVKVLVEQLRLRNIGGLIIIDFIDMERSSNRRKILEALQQELKKEKARTNILGMSELGLIEMTRRRTRENLPQMLCAPCPRCEGTGRVRSVPTIAYDLLRRIRAEAARNSSLERITAAARPDIVQFLRATEKRGLEQLERDIGAKLDLKADPERSDTAPFEILGTEKP